MASYRGIPVVAGRLAWLGVLVAVPKRVFRLGDDQSLEKLLTKSAAE
jgi:hypothetical protein